MILQSNTFLIKSSCSNKFLSAPVCCVWVWFDWKLVVSATVFVNTAAIYHISAAIAVGMNVYCKVSTIAILFANTAAITATVAELLLLLWVLPLPLP